MRKLSEKFLNFGVGSFYYFKERMKNVMEEIERKGEEHSKDLENFKKEIVNFAKIPKKLFEDFIKSCGFITKEDFEKFKEEMKNG